MNYVMEIHAFYERLESIPLSANAISLWHALMHMKHKQNGKKEFQAASAALCFKSALNKDLLIQARQELVQKEWLSYTEVEDGLAALYVLYPLSEECETNEEVSNQPHTNQTIPTNRSHVNEKRISKNDRSQTEQESAFQPSYSAGSEATSKCKTNGKNRVKAHLKKLEFQDKMLKNEWQRSVNLALTDVDISNETLRAWQQYHPGDPVTIFVQPGQPKQAESTTESSAQQTVPIAVKTEQTEKTPATNKEKKSNQRQKNDDSKGRKQPGIQQTQKKHAHKQQGKRKPHSTKRREKEVTSMGPFELSPEEEEQVKVLQTFTF